jgi:tetratricopeptide (TPR) repeat protein
MDPNRDRAEAQLREACRELRRRLRDGEGCAVEDFRGPYPELWDDPEAVLELIYTEFTARAELGQPANPEAWYARFPQWRDRLEKLFRIHAAVVGRSDASTGAPTLAAVEAVQGPHAAVGAARQVGNYELLEEIGRGGMGVVYKARQAGLNRVVALKMILAGAHAGSQVRARFRKEAEAVARLQHANIVQVHEVGEHDGLPYLSMEYVDGGSLADLLESRRSQGVVGLPPAEAVRLVEALARAVQYAHERGVIHRDLKPGNVLLAACGLASAKPQAAVPKLTDFGLAKTLGAEGKSTRTGALLGTPRYMAPEQAGGAKGLVGPATDVYALGAILYELLTGRPPFEGTTVEETLELVRSAEPVPPGQLRPRLPRDLQTICLKCLAKEPSKRYGSARDLADDLERFAQGRPIRARPVGPLGRLGRWCRRKPALAGLLAALLIVGLVGVGSVTALWLRAERLRRDADARRREALANLKLAREAADNYATRVSENLRLQQADLRPLRKELLETVVPLYEKLIEGYGDDPEIQAERGKVCFQLGVLTAEVGEREKATDLFTQSAAIFRRLADQHPDEPEYQVGLAKAHNDLGKAYTQASRYADAEREFRQAVAIRRELARRDPGDAQNRKSLALHLRNLGNLCGEHLRQPTEAEDAYRQSLALLEELANEHPDSVDFQHNRAMTLNNRAVTFVRARDYPKAEAALDAARTIWEDVCARGRATDLHEDGLGQCYLNLGEVHAQLKQWEKAEAAFARSLALLEKVTRTDPSVIEYQYHLARHHYQVGRFHHTRQEFDKARASYLKAAAVHEERLSPYYPAVPEYEDNLASVRINLGLAYQAGGQPDKADVEYEKALTIRHQLARSRPDSPAAYDDLAGATSDVARAYLARGLAEKPAAEYRRLAALSSERVGAFPAIPAYPETLALCHFNLATLAYEAGKMPAAVESYREAIRVQEQLIRDHGSDVKYQRKLALYCTSLGRAYREQNMTDEAEAASRDGVERWEAVVRADEKDLSSLLELGGAYGDMGTLMKNVGRLPEALEWSDRAIAPLETVLKKHPRNEAAREYLRNALWQRGQALTDLSRHAEALPDWERAMTLSSGRYVPQLRARRARTVALLADHDRAAREAEELAAKPPPWKDGYWDLARVFSLSGRAAREDARLTPSERDRLADRHAARAMAMLAQARAAGAFKTAAQVDRLKTNSDLDPLRSRDDFKRLLAEVEQQTKAGPS